MWSIQPGVTFEKMRGNGQWVQAVLVISFLQQEGSLGRPASISIGKVTCCGILDISLDSSKKKFSMRFHYNATVLADLTRASLVFKIVV